MAFGIILTWLQFLALHSSWRICHTAEPHCAKAPLQGHQGKALQSWKSGDTLSVTVLVLTHAFSEHNQVLPEMWPVCSTGGRVVVVVVVMNPIVEYCISNCPHHDRQLVSGLKNTTLSIFENSEFLQKKGGKQGSYVPLMATWSRCLILEIKKPRLKSDSHGHKWPQATTGTQIRMSGLISKLYQM